MEIVYLLIPLSLLLLALGIYGFFWAVKHRQFCDMDTPSRAILESDHQVNTDAATGSFKRNRESGSEP